MPGYEEFLRALADPGHEEHEHYLSWVGGSFNLRAFDLDDVNSRLAEINL